MAPERKFNITTSFAVQTTLDTAKLFHVLAVDVVVNNVIVEPTQQEKPKPAPKPAVKKAAPKKKAPVKPAAKPIKK